MTCRRVSAPCPATPATSGIMMYTAGARTFSTHWKLTRVASSASNASVAAGSALGVWLGVCWKLSDGGAGVLRAHFALWLSVCGDMAQAGGRMHVGQASGCTPGSAVEQDGHAVSHALQTDKCLLQRAALQKCTHVHRARTRKNAAESAKSSPTARTKNCQAPSARPW